MKEISLTPIRVDTGSRDQNGCLAMADGKLVAVIVELEAPEHGDHRGMWFLEAGFGPCKSGDAMTFETIDRAKEWIEKSI